MCGNTPMVTQITMSVSGIHSQGKGPGPVAQHREGGDFDGHF